MVVTGGHGEDWQIASSSRIAARRGGFAYYTGTDVDLLAGPEEAISYLQEFRKTMVLVRDIQFERDFQDAMLLSRFQVLRELRVGSHDYIALRSAG